MQGNQIAIRAGAAVHRNPEGSLKAVFYFLLIIVAFFIFFKVIKAIKNFGTIGTSEEDKQDILGGEDFSAAQNWLDPVYGIKALLATKKYKTAAQYQKQRSISDMLLNNTAEQIHDSKTGPYANSTEVQSAIAALPTKAAISLMALRFDTVYSKYDGKLKTFIGKHLNVKEVQTLNKIISKKPDL